MDKEVTTMICCSLWRIEHKAPDTHTHTHTHTHTLAEENLVIHTNLRELDNAATCARTHIPTHHMHIIVAHTNIHTKQCQSSVNTTTTKQYFTRTPNTNN